MSSVSLHPRALTLNVVLRRLAIAVAVGVSSLTSFSSSQSAEATRRLTLECSGMQSGDFGVQRPSFKVTGTLTIDFKPDKAIADVRWDDTGEDSRVSHALRWVKNWTVSPAMYLGESSDTDSIQSVVRINRATGDIWMRLTSLSDRVSVTLGGNCHAQRKAKF
jgi:hypothetical protein